MRVLACSQRDFRRGKRSRKCPAGMALDGPWAVAVKRGCSRGGVLTGGLVLGSVLRLTASTLHGSSFRYMHVHGVIGRLWVVCLPLLRATYRATS